MAKQIFKSKLVLLTLLILLITSCSKETNTISVQPLKTTIKGKLGDYISIVNDKYTITKIKDDLSADWEISFKLKTLKSGDFNIDNSTIDFKLQLVDENGKPITGLGDFWMATGLFGTVNELNKLREFIKGKENQEDWFTLPMQVKNKDFENKLPKNATHFIIRTIVKGKAISENQNEVKIEDNQDSILKTIWTGKTENDDVMLKFNKITKDSLFGEHTLQSTANGNIRIKLLKGTYTKDLNNNIKAILTEYKLNEFEKPKYKTNGILKFIISDEKINGLIDFGTKKINFNLTPIEVSNEEFESRDFGNVYNQKTISPKNKIDEMLDEYDRHLQSYENIFAKNSNGNDTKMMTEIMGVMDEIKNTEKKYKKYINVDNNDLTKSQLARLQNLAIKLNKVNKAVSSGNFNSFYEGSNTFKTKSTNKKDSNLNIDKMLDQYDDYVKSYVKLLVSASKGNTNSLTKSIEVMNKANSFYEKLQNIDESKFTIKHINRMNIINSKMLEAAMKIQN